MAAEETLQEKKRRLALSLDASRHRLRANRQELQQQLRPSHAAARYLRHHPWRVFGGTAVGVALLTILLRPRPRDERKRHPLLRRLIGFGGSLALPALRFWVVKQAKTYLQQPDQPLSTESLLGR